MISYEPFWETMKNKGVTRYQLEYHWNIGGGTFYRLKRNESVSTNTIDLLCNILECDITDVLKHTPEHLNRQE